MLNYFMQINVKISGGSLEVGGGGGPIDETLYLAWYPGTRGEERRSRD